MLVSQIRKLLDENAIVPLWPEAGQMLGLGRYAAYQGAARGEIKVLSVGRTKKVPTSWLREQLGLSEPLKDAPRSATRKRRASVELVTR